MNSYHKVPAGDGAIGGTQTGVTALGLPAMRAGIRATAMSRGER